MQSDLDAHLYRSLSNYLDYPADLAHMIAPAVPGPGAAATTAHASLSFRRTSTSRTAYLDPAERSHKLAHEYRYCSNCVIAELVHVALQMVRPSCPKRCGLLEHLPENAQLWVARDAAAKPDPSAAPNTSSSCATANALSRTDHDTGH